MKVPFGWLKEFVSVRCKAEEVARRLTHSGFEVESLMTVRGEQILDINVTPNRGDALSILGIAREVSALFQLPLKIPTGKKSGGKAAKSLPLSVKVQASKAPFYSLAVLSDVKVGPSPEWLVTRLAQVGMRSINPIVDVTNYVLMELGQPLHAFDQKSIRGGKLVVRMAKPGEHLLTLDGEEHELIRTDVVIADQDGPIALAGIMGGKDSEINSQTNDIVLESAFFDPASIRKSARRLGIQTDSSYRFERGVNPEGVLPALTRAISLIQELAGGKLQGPVVSLAEGKQGTPKVLKRKIKLNPMSVPAYLGGQWTTAEIKHSLESLAFEVSQKTRDLWEVTVPAYRSDISGPPDLMEEVIRLQGLEKIPVTFPSLKQPPLPASDTLKREKRIRQLLVDLGFQETIHFSFLSPDEVKILDPTLSENGVLLENPLGHEYSFMRPNLMISLLKTAAYHHRHKIFSTRFFEIGPCFWMTNGKVVEKKRLGGLLSGDHLFSHWGESEKACTFFDAKGMVERLLRDLGTQGVVFKKGSFPFLHPGKQAVLLKSDGTSVGLVGEIHPAVHQRFELKKSTFVFEIDLEILSLPKKASFEEYSRQPVVERDLALIVNESLEAGDLLRYIEGQDPSIKDVRLFDLYRGEPIPAGKKSLGIALQLGMRDRTLTELEINGIYERLVSRVKESFGAEIR